jgi:alkylated DNA repair dioxygenase AlkB
VDPSEPNALHKRSPFSSTFCEIHFQNTLSDFAWQRPCSQLSHKPIRRQTIWLANCNCEYKYSGLSFAPSAAPDWFKAFQDNVFTAAGVHHIGLNSCNINLYQDGSEFLDFHSDNEQIFAHSQKGVPILSLSLGATRDFQFLNLATGNILTFPLVSGDLQFMAGLLQTTHKHGVPKCKSKDARINFTWRRITQHTKFCRDS